MRLASALLLLLVAVSGCDDSPAKDPVVGRPCAPDPAHFCPCGYFCAGGGVCQRNDLVPAPLCDAGTPDGSERD